MSSTYKITASWRWMTFAAVLLLSAAFTSVARADTSDDEVLACKKLVSFSLLDTYMRVGNQSGLISALMMLLQIGDCVILQYGKQLTPVDYVDDKTCFKFEGSGPGCMWIRNNDIITGGVAPEKEDTTP